LASRGDEGRIRLRKASGSCQKALIRGFPNGTTQHGANHVTTSVGRTQGSETSQYLKEEKSIEIPKVAASEIGIGLLVIAYVLGEQVGNLEHRG
jgi:hypothetical protein